MLLFKEIVVKPVHDIEPNTEEVIQMIDVHHQQQHNLTHNMDYQREKSKMTLQSKLGARKKSTVIKYNQDGASVVMKHKVANTFIFSITFHFIQSISINDLSVHNRKRS